MTTYSTRRGALGFITEIANLHTTTEARRARHAVGARHRRPIGIDAGIVGVREREAFRLAAITGILEATLAPIGGTGRGIRWITLQATIGDARQQRAVARLRTRQSPCPLGMDLNEDLVGQETQELEARRTPVFFARNWLAAASPSADTHALVLVLVISFRTVGISLARSAGIRGGWGVMDALLIARQSSAAVSRSGVTTIRIIGTVLPDRTCGRGRRGIT